MMWRAMGAERPPSSLDVRETVRNLFGAAARRTWAGMRNMINRSRTLAKITRAPCEAATHTTRRPPDPARMTKRSMPACAMNTR
jgi:hypothetical protein